MAIKIKFPFKSSIKAKFITTFLLIAIFISLIYGATFLVFRQSISEYEQIIRNADMANRIPAMYKVLIDDDFKNYLVEANQEFDKFQGSVNEINNLVLYIKRNTKPEHRDSIAQLTGISNLLNTIKEQTSLAIEYRKKGDLDNANKQFYELGKLSEYLKENINQYISRELSYSIASREQIYRKSVIMGLISAFLIILITVAGLIYGIKLSQSTTKALLQIANRDDISESEDHTPYGEEELDQLYSKFAKMQKNIKDYITRLTLSEKRLSTILNEMTDCVIITDVEGRIEYINPAVIKIFGYQTDEIIMQNIDKLVPDIEIRDGAYFLGETNAAALLIDGKLQHNALRKNNKVFPIEMGINKATIEEKTFFIVVIHDITEHKEVEKIKDEFISVVSHELRTPLTSIKGGLEFSLSGALGALPEKVTSILTIAYNNSKQLGNLINDILDISKISQGKVDFCFEKLCLSEFIQETINQNMSFAKGFNVNINTKNPINSNIFINSDKGRLMQVLTNLVSNAVKFSNMNGDVDLYVEEKENSVVISVQDYGIGIPEEFQDKIFQKFFQVDSSATRSKGGTGLGLNITQMLIERMNGKISFTSEAGKGSIFMVEVPKYVDKTNDEVVEPLSISPSVSVEQ